MAQPSSYYSMSVCLFVCLSVTLSVCLSVTLSVCLSVTLSVCQYIYFPFKIKRLHHEQPTTTRSIQNYTAQTTFRRSNLAMLMSLFETTFALQGCRVTGMINHHLVLKSVSFRLPSSSLALFASLFKYLTACSPQRPKCSTTRNDQWAGPFWQ